MFYKRTRQLPIAYKVLLLTSMIMPSVSDKVLLLPFPWPSHYTQLERIGMELTRRDHDVIMIIPSTETYESKSILKHVEFKIPKLESNTFVSIAEKRLETRSGFGLNWLVEYVKLLEEFGRSLLEDRVILQLAKSADLVISDTAFLVAPIFADYHKLPLVFVSPFGHLPGCMADTFGNMENPSLVPTFVATSLFENIGLPQRMNFLERSFNLMSNVISKILRDLITVPILRPLTKQYSSKTLLQLWRQASLVLIPMDYSLEYPRADVPFVKMIGPLTPKDTLSPLPKPFDKILRNSNNGVIVVSFGITNKLHYEDAMRILEGLTEVGYTVIWKYDRRKVEKMMEKLSLKKPQIIRNDDNCEEDLSECKFCRNHSQVGNVSIVCSTKCKLRKCEKFASSITVSNNVYIFDWLPQQQLLQQKETKLLVTHCGLNSLYEALYHKTQVLCVPLFGEQFDNAGRVVSRNIGKALRIKDLNKNSLREAVNDLMHNKVYLNNVKKISLRLRRSRETPVEKAAYWVEFVLAEKGDMSYLRPPILSYQEYFLLDVILFWGIISVSFSWLIVKLLTYDKRFSK